MLGRVLVALGLVGLLVAFVLAKSPVDDGTGAQCGSAWRAANGSLHFGGDRTEAQIAVVREACRESGEPRMRVAYVLAVASAAALGGGLVTKRRGTA